ncbi:hypothetical protein FQR65_LT13373 [Abscondita terminalis]|nr:hypothetical protein FQR65_LT13373 [Abscondita terminalis]
MISFIVYVTFSILCYKALGNPRFYVTLDENDLECIHELGFDSRTIAAAFDENFKIQEEDSDINKFFNCSWNKSKFIDENNALDTKKIKNWLTEWDIRDLHTVYEVNNVQNLNELVDDCINVCSTRRSKKSEDFALKMYNCLLDCLLWKRLSKR